MSDAVQWVAQEGPLDCVAAAFAMLAGTTIREAKAEFKWPMPEGEDRYCPSELYLIGKRRGWKWKHTSARERAKNDNALPGVINLALVKVHEGASMYHAVVVKADGTVLDPATPSPRKLTDYHHVGAMSSVDR